VLALRAPIVVVGLALALLRPGPLAAAQDTWLDQPLTGWNASGAAIPPAEPGGESLGRCARLARPPQFPEDQQVVGAGWTLFGQYQAGWGLALVHATSAFDGMCRPSGYQVFVFVNGVYAGTLSPEPMQARTTGAETMSWLGAPDGSLAPLYARFSRYAPDDPLCCPSLPAAVVEYAVEQGPAGPYVVPTGKSQG